MSSVRSPRKWHRLVAIVICAFGGLTVLGVAMDFGQVGRGSGTDVNAIVVILSTAAAAIAILMMLGKHFDRTHPGSGFVDAVVRLILPVMGLVAASAWLMNKGIFSRSSAPYVPVAISAAVAVLVCRWILGQTSTVGRTETAPAAAVTATPAATKVDLAARPFGEGAPQWPTAPPTGPVPTTAPPMASAPIAAPPTTAAPTKQRSAKTHRITSGLITVLWIPLGGLVWLAANWCPDIGAANAAFATSTIYVIVQLVANPVGGWLLDRRYGREGGPALAIGRSVALALVLAIALGFALSLFVPDGQSTYCG